MFYGLVLVFLVLYGLQRCVCQPKRETLGHKFSGKVVWVTGASSGIGEQLALALSTCNAKLVLSARREEVLHQVARECNQRAGKEVPL